MPTVAPRKQKLKSQAPKVPTRRSPRFADELTTGPLIVKPAEPTGPLIVKAPIPTGPLIVLPPKGGEQPSEKVLSDESNVEQATGGAEKNTNLRCRAEGVIAGQAAALVRKSLAIDDMDENAGLPSTESIQAMFADIELTAMATEAMDPVTWNEAMRSEHRDGWIEAAKVRKQALDDLKAYTLVPRPKDRKVLRHKMVYKTKRHQDGSIERHTVRLTPKGFLQIPGLDFFANETFAPTVSYGNFRFCLAYAAASDYEIIAIDVITAYPQAPLKEDVYIEQPDIWSDGSDNVWKLNVSLEGLKQSGRNFYKLLREELTRLGFKILRSLPSVYHILHKDGIEILIPVYVDDGFLMGNNMSFIKDIIQKLSKQIKLRSLGEIKTALGMKVTRDRAKKSLTLSSPLYTQKVLETFRMQDSNPVSTPMVTGLQMSASDPKVEEKVPYLELVGSVGWLAQTSRPDISHSVNMLSRFASSPTQKAWTAAKHLLKYLKGTGDWGINLDGGSCPSAMNSFKSTSLPQLCAFSDSSYGDCLDTQKSTSGNVVYLNNAPIFWAARKQTSMADSTQAAELMELNFAGRELKAARNALGEITGVKLPPSPLFCDNRAASSMARDPSHHSKAKHLAIKWMWIREQVEEGEISIHDIGTKDQIADIFTKPLQKDQFAVLRQQLGLIQVTS